MFSKKDEKDLDKRICFESEIAAEILKNSAAFPAVKKITKIIINLLEKNEESLIKNPSFIKSIEAIETELFSSTFFGTIAKKITYCHSPEKLIGQIRDALNNQSDNLPLVIHIHQIFMQKIFDQLHDKRIPFDISETDTLSQQVAQELTIAKDYDSAWLMQKKRLVQLIFHNDLFSKTRIPTKTPGEQRDVVGYGDSRKCADVQYTTPHLSAIGTFKPDPDSNWTKLISDKKLSFIGAPSGHAGSSLLLTTLAGNFNKEQNLQYLTTVIGVLTGGGFHTIPEILAVAVKLKMVSSVDDYSEFLSESFMKTQSYKKLAKSPDSFFNHGGTFFDSITTAVIDVVESCPSYFPKNPFPLDPFNQTALPFFAFKQFIYRDPILCLPPPPKM